MSCNQEIEHDDYMAYPCAVLMNGCKCWSVIDVVKIRDSHKPQISQERSGLYVVLVDKWCKVALYLPSLGWCNKWCGVASGYGDSGFILWH